MTMAEVDYEQSSRILKNFLEDYQEQRLETATDLHIMLRAVLAEKYVRRGTESEYADSLADEDALFLIANLDTLRPILEHWWAKDEVKKIKPQPRPSRGW